MTKIVCDICGKEMSLERVIPFKDFKFCISANGRTWDVCNECREELNKWMNKRKAEGSDKA